MLEPCKRLDKVLFDVETITVLLSKVELRLNAAALSCSLQVLHVEFHVAFGPCPDLLIVVTFVPIWHRREGYHWRQHRYIVPRFIGE